jgi:hypothetical protein
VNRLKSILNRTALGLFRAVPDRVAQHALFLAQSQRETLDRWGYHIRPIHYYEPLPDFRSITKEQINRKRDYAALDFNWEAQLGLLNDLATYRDELRELDRPNADRFNFQNGYFDGFDAAVYYSLIRYLKPRQVIEVGAGYSTRIAQKALERNRVEGSEGKLTCIEPNPEPRLTNTRFDFDLIKKPVQEIEVDFFSSLEANDILFIDSTHTVKFGSDVCYEFLDILPKLSPDVWVHVHDIFFPHDYPPEWLLEKRLALNEQYLLEAFLAFNVDFAVRLSNRWICLDHGEIAAQLWSTDRTGNSCSSSFWMKRIK